MLCPSGIPISFTAVFVGATAADVAMSVWDVTGVSPVLAQVATLMTPVSGPIYSGKFTPVAGKLYAVVRAVYTDGTFATLNGSFTPVVDAIQCQVMLPSADHMVGKIDEANSGNPACGNSPFSIFQGDSKTLYLKLENTWDDPFDLTNCTEIVVNLPNADGTTEQLKLSLSQVVIESPSVLGKFSVPVSSGVSGNLQTGTYQSIDVTFTVGGQVFTVTFNQALSVFEAS